MPQSAGTTCGPILIFCLHCGYHVKNKTQSTCVELGSGKGSGVWWIRFFSQKSKLHEYPNPDSRLAAVAIDYAARPDRTVIVAPYAADRLKRTLLIRAGLKAQERLAEESRSCLCWSSRISQTMSSRQLLTRDPETRSTTRRAASTPKEFQTTARPPCFP